MENGEIWRNIGNAGMAAACANGGVMRGIAPYSAAAWRKWRDNTWLS